VYFGNFWLFGSGNHDHNVLLFLLLFVCFAMDTWDGELIGLAADCSIIEIWGPTISHRSLTGRVCQCFNDQATENENFQSVIEASKAVMRHVSMTNKRCLA
jgi:hypothetical protein